MSNELTVKVTERAARNEQWWEGVVSIQGLQPTKLSRKSDGSTKFTTRSSITGAAKRLATNLGFEGVAADQSNATPTIKRAAKKKTKKAATTNRTAKKKSTTTNRTAKKKSTTTNRTAKKKSTTTKRTPKKRVRRS